MRIPLVVLLLVSLNGPRIAQAQTECSAGRCEYRFASKSWVDWEEVTCPIAGCSNPVADRSGVMNVANYPQDQHPQWTHLRWDVGDFDRARIVFRFTGDNGHPGWFRKLTPGLEWCEPLTHADRASDEMVILVLHDTGEKWIGAYWGGDEGPLGFPVTPGHGVAPGLVGFSVAGIIVQDEDGMRVLSRVFLPEVPMGESRWMSIETYKDFKGRRFVRAEGSGWGLEMPLELAPAPGVTSLLTGVMGATFCIYEPGGRIDRQVTVDQVVGWR